jgi:segregation and condensation protein B
MTLEHQIEAILLFKNEPVEVSSLSKSLNVPTEEIKAAITSLQEFYSHRGIVVVFDGEKACFGTNSEVSELIETMQKEEFSRELGRAGLETLSIVLYRGPISRKEIDNIRGVNSGFILRNLLIRGLVEKTESEAGVRSFSYKPTLELFRHLGLEKIQDLPEYTNAFKRIVDFEKQAGEDTETTP